MSIPSRHETKVPYFKGTFFFNLRGTWWWYTIYVYLLHTVPKFLCATWTTDIYRDVKKVPIQSTWSCISFRRGTFLFTGTYIKIHTFLQKQKNSSNCKKNAQRQRERGKQFLGKPQLGMRAGKCWVERDDGCSSITPLRKRKKTL